MGTIAAVAVGGIIAALLTTVISQAVSGRRGLADRDEIRNFTTFVQNALTNDATCTASLSGKSFKPGGKTNFSLNIGYSAQADAEIKKGFTFDGGNLEVGELSMQDHTPNAVQFKIGIDNDGKVKEAVVRRHVAKVKLQLINHATGAAHRARYFEIPLLYNVAEKRIEMCNNDINIGDACQAMGFRWDVSSNPPKCIPQNSCMYGGAYTLTSSGGCTANPSTGACSCPSGPGTNYQAVAAGSVNIQRTGCFKGCDPFHYDMVYQCFWCPK
jgi:hypothetical protein